MFRLGNVISASFGMKEMLEDPNSMVSISCSSSEVRPVKLKLSFKWWGRIGSILWSSQAGPYDSLSNVHSRSIATVQESIER